MVRRLLVGLVAAGLLLIGAPAYAQSPVTETIVDKNQVDTFVMPLPINDCLNGPLYTITLTTNRVTHSTTLADGRIHARIAWTGTFVAVPLAADPGLATYTGTLTLTNGTFEQHGQVVTTTFTYTLHGTGSDGSGFKTHLTMHLNVPPAAAVNELFRCH
jgi:hypothetical protein